MKDFDQFVSSSAYFDAMDRVDKTLADRNLQNDLKAAMVLISLETLRAYHSWLFQDAPEPQKTDGR